MISQSYPVNISVPTAADFLSLCKVIGDSFDIMEFKIHAAAISHPAGLLDDPLPEKPKL
jgi:hypothetical protein